MKEILPHTVREEQRGLNREIITVVTTVDAQHLLQKNWKSVDSYLNAL